MGCGTSKNVVSRMKDQQAKLDDLINRNQELQEKLQAIRENKAIDQQANNEVGDVTSLKSTVDNRFSKLEKTIEKIHEDFKAKIFEGLPKSAVNVNEQQQMHQQPNASITLDFDKEYKKLMLAKNNMEIINMQWKELLDDSTEMVKKKDDDDTTCNFDTNVFDEHVSRRYIGENIKHFYTHKSSLCPNYIKTEINLKKSEIEDLTVGHYKSTLGDEKLKE